MAAVSPSVEAGVARLGRLPRAWLITAATAPLALLLVMAGVLVMAAAAPPGARVGMAAPHFSVADLDGNPVRLSDLNGQPVIVNFWASWCPPCVEEFPLLTAAAEQHASDGLVVIGIVYGDRSEAARAFMGRMEATWPAAMDPGGQVAARYGVHGPPASFFIDPDGTLAGRQIGPLTPTDLERNLTLILGGGE